MAMGFLAAQTVWQVHFRALLPSTEPGSCGRCADGRPAVSDPVDIVTRGRHLCAQECTCSDETAVPCMTKRRKLCPLLVHHEK